MSDLVLDLRKDINIYTNLVASRDVHNNKFTSHSFIEIKGFVDDFFNYEKLGISSGNSIETANYFSLIIHSSEEIQGNVRNVFILDNEFRIDYYIDSENFNFLLHLLSDRKARVNIDFFVLKDPNNKEAFSILDYEEAPFKILDTDNIKTLMFNLDNLGFWANVRFINSIELQDKNIIQESESPSITNPAPVNTPATIKPNHILFYVIIGILLLILIKI